MELAIRKMVFIPGRMYLLFLSMWVLGLEGVKYLISWFSFNSRIIFNGTAAENKNNRQGFN